jgi:hypothetical protein
MKPLIRESSVKPPTVRMRSIIGNRPAAGEKTAG